MKIDGKPAIEVVLDLIGQHGKPMLTSEIRSALPLSAAAIYSACRNATDDGYLIERRVKCASGVGRKQCEYVRTAKAYVPSPASPMTVRRRAEKERDELLVRDISADRWPFRHWQDVVLFGGYDRSFVPQISFGTVYRQPMDVGDELEAA